MGPGESLSLKSGATFSFKGLALKPQAAFVLSNNHLTTTGTTNNSVLSAINRFYNLTSISSPYSGEVIFSYSDSELNGLTESDLILASFNGTEWSISDATAEYDWFIETINGQRILTVSGGFYGQDEIIIENEGDYCNEEWYFLPITDSWFERVDCD